MVTSLPSLTLAEDPNSGLEQLSSPMQPSPPNHAELLEPLSATTENQPMGVLKGFCPEGELRTVDAGNARSDTEPEG